MFVMSYEQHMKHWGNHRKDRFTQQCAGPQQDPSRQVAINTEHLPRMSFQTLMANVSPDSFPVYVKQGSGGMWSFTNERDSFGTKISDIGEMRKFYYDYAV